MESVLSAARGREPARLATRAITDLISAPSGFAPTPQKRILNRSKRACGRDVRIALGSVCVLAAGLASYAGSVFAQSALSTQDDTATATQDQPGASTQAQGSGQLQEVVVTATRREESIIQVPISITALSGGDLTAHNVQNLSDYAQLVPNLSYAYSGFDATDARNITIRGIQGPDTTAFYIDDTPVPTSIDPRVLDINRIEVLRGPQGTLFGESSMGGAVRLITNQPDTHNFYAQYMVQGGYTTDAGTPNGGLNGVLNFAVVPDTLAVRLVGYIEHDGGWLKRYYLNEPYNPANAGFMLAPFTFPYVGGTSTLGDQARETSGGASISVRLDATTNFSVVARMLYQISKQIGYPVQVGLIKTATQNLTDDPLLLDNLPVRAFPFQSYIEDRWYLPSLDLNYAGPGFAVHSSTSYFERTPIAWETDAEGESQTFERFQGLAEFNALPVQDHDWENGTKVRRATEEVRATLDPIPVGFLKFSGVLGYYWSRNWSGPEQYLEVGRDQNGSLWGGSFGFESSGAWPNNQDWIVPPAVFTYTDSSWFGEFDFKLFDKVTLSIGDRYFHLTQFNPGISAFIGWSAGIVSVVPPTPNQTENVGHSPKYSVTYEFSQDASAYLSASRGFRAGTARSANQLPPAYCDADEIALGLNPATAGNQTPDYLWNYEAGTKFRLLNPNMIVSAAVFEMDWTHIQQNIILACSYGIGINAGEAKSSGAELELTVLPVQPLSIHAAGGFQNAHITEPGPGQEIGQSLFLVPRWTASTGFIYTFADTTTFPYPSVAGHVFFSGDFSYTGSRLSQNTSQFYTVTIPAFHVVNARVGMQFPNSELSLNITNLTNDQNNLADYAIQGWQMRLYNTPTPSFFVNPPRTYMVQYQHHL